MRKSSDTSLRQLAILHLLPHAPRKLSTAEIHRSLLDQGFDVELRTIQRDMDRLSPYYPITNDQRGQKNIWYRSDFGYTPRLPPVTHASIRSMVNTRKTRQPGKPAKRNSRSARKTTLDKELTPQKFKAIVGEPILAIIRQYPIAENQVLSPLTMKLARIEAEISITDDFVLWLKRCGPSIVVETPAKLRREIENYAYDYARAYANKAPLLSKKEMVFLQKQSHTLQKGRPRQTVTLHLFARKEVTNYLRGKR